MDNKQNLSYITLDGFIEVNKYRYVYFVVMFTVYILIICCNSTIVCLIVIHKNLHEPMYIFIAALLTNSALYSTALYPKILTDVLSDKQMISQSACLFQWFIYYSLGSAEFLLLAAMSYDRYVSICKPLQYPTIMGNTNVSIMLVLAWIFPSFVVAVSVVQSANVKLCRFTFKGIICNSSIYKLQFGLTHVLVLPVLFILFTYSQILIVSYQNSREVRAKAAQTCLPHLLVLVNFSCVGAYDILLVRLETHFPKTMTLQAILYHPLFNPLIYGFKMKEIHKHLVRLLRSKNCFVHLK
ncbi:hypothetical protein Q5P01_014146 [Channa striata]|uniref:G-protein coupled receptors family 1 profile domain-containing protein n=1 Tax=Channa striata TaxID=64152 RepID=A0AA88SRC5_CHASR|nr:hypothetical protein Q5P01_014146 [Channa striata]